jgi:hypothetical protein
MFHHFNNNNNNNNQNFNINNNNNNNNQPNANTNFIDIKTNFENEINQAALEHTKLSFAITNLDNNMALKRTHIETKQWPDHIKNKVNKLDITLQEVQAIKFLQDELVQMTLRKDNLSSKKDNIFKNLLFTMEQNLIQADFQEVKTCIDNQLIDIQSVFQLKKLHHTKTFNRNIQIAEEKKNLKLIKKMENNQHQIDEETRQLKFIKSEINGIKNELKKLKPNKKSGEHKKSPQKKQNRKEDKPSKSNSKYKIKKPNSKYFKMFKWKFRKSVSIYKKLHKNKPSVYELLEAKSFNNNLSLDKTLDKNCLILGLKFIPSVKRLTSTELNYSLTRVMRAMLIKFHVFNATLPAVHPKLKVFSIWIPNINSPRSREKSFIYNECQRIFNKISLLLEHSRMNHNLNNYDITNELKILKQRSNIKITLSDKNLGLVIFDTITYHKHMLKLLHGNPVYKLLPTQDDYPGYLNFIMRKKFDSELNNIFSETELKFINAMKYKESYIGIFHGLPKLHKNKPLDQLPFRPIIAGRPHQLQARISTVLSTRLLPILTEFSTILKNSFDLKTRIENKTCDKLYFVTLDFESLYTSIPLDDLYNTLTNYNESPSFNKIKNSTIKILQFIFKNNYFSYANQTYQQEDGIAMGTNVAPIIANLYLAIKFDKVAKTLYNIKHFHRYIDDCFFLFKGDILNFENSFELQILKRAAYPINITFSVHSNIIDFLDVSIFNNNNTIAFRIFQKPLNQYHYIPQFSNHPAHNLTGFIKGELIRYRRLSTLDTDYSYIKSKFFERLIKRGYTKNIINPIFYNQNLFQPKPDLDRYIPGAPKSTFNFVIRHNLQPNLNRLIKTELVLLASTMNKIQKDYNINIRLAYKSNPNIKKLTTRSELTQEQIELVNNIERPHN